MGIFDKFRGQSGNQAEEEQQDANQPTGGQFSDQAGQRGMQTAQNTIGQQGGPQDSGMGGYQDPNQPGYQDPTQGGGSQGQNQNQGYQDPNQPGYQDPTQGGYQDPNRPGYQDPTQGGGYQDQNQNQGDQSGYHPNQDQYGDQNQGQ
jgi:hypothetical protein